MTFTEIQKQLNIYGFDKKQSFIVSLNSKKLKNVEEFGNKASKLGEMINAKIPIPKGIAISGNYYKEIIRDKEKFKQVVSLIKALKTHFNNSIVIRSSANIEDTTDTSLAGVFESVYIQKDDEIENALKYIFQQAYSETTKEVLETHKLNPDLLHMGLVVQELIMPKIAGVLYTDVNKDNNVLIQYVQGYGNKLVDGEASSNSLLFDLRNELITESIGFDLLPIEYKVLLKFKEYIEKIKSFKSFHNQFLDVEFVIDSKGKLYLVQARSLTRKLEDIKLEETIPQTLENIKAKFKQIADEEKKYFSPNPTVFTNSNHIELLPKPKEMDYGIFAYIFGGTAHRTGGIPLGKRNLGYISGDEANHITHFVGGKPYMSLLKDASNYYAGYPDTVKQYNNIFLAYYVKKVKEDKDNAVYPMMKIYIQDKPVSFLKEFFNDNDAERYYQISERFRQKQTKRATRFYSDYNKRILPRELKYLQHIQSINLSKLTNTELGDLFIQILEHLRTSCCIYYTMAARLTFDYSAFLRQNLFQLGLTKEQVDKAYADVILALDDSMFTLTNLKLVNAETFEEAIKLANKSIGHYSIGEQMEVRHQRFKENPEYIEAYVKNLRNSDFKQTFEANQKKREQTLELLRKNFGLTKKQEQIIKHTQEQSALRETIKYYYLYEYSTLRDILETLAQKLNVLDGNIYHLYPDEIKSFIKTPSRYAHLINSRKQSWKNYENIQLPFVILEEEIKNLALALENQEHKGVLLSQGNTIEGIVVNLDKIEDFLHAKKTIEKFKKTNENVILVAKQISLGHDPLLTLVDCIVLENAGIVSHGAQRARELGKGAIGGISTSQLITGTRIKVDFSNLTVTITTL